MNDLEQLALSVCTLESKVARLRTASLKRKARIQSKIAALEGFTSSREASTAQKLQIRKALQSIESQMEANIMPSLEEVEKEVDRIYGDQSLNSTYYFSRKNVRAASGRDPKVAAFLRQGDEMETPWGEMSYEQVQEAVDGIYGNQSDNSTYYFSRGARTAHALEDVIAGRSEMTLEEVMRQMDGLYGDQSKNETFYPSRRQNSDAVTSGWQMDEQHYLMSDAMEEEAEADMEVDAAGYEIPGYFSDANFDSHNTVAPSYRVDNTVETPGYWADEMSEAPHVVENRAPVMASLSTTDKGVIAAFIDHHPLQGKALMTDGSKLIKVGMGGRVMAEWVRGKIEVTEGTLVQSDDHILRALKKVVPASKLLAPIKL